MERFILRIFKNAIFKNAKTQKNETAGTQRRASTQTPATHSAYAHV
jgi:hypothetical protein